MPHNGTWDIGSVNLIGPTPYERIAAKLFPHSRLLRAWPLTGGISAEMTALEIASPGGETQRWIVRRPGEAALRSNPRAAEDEFRVLEMLHAQGLSTPAPYALDSSGEIFPAPYLVIEYIDGQHDFSLAYPDDFAAQMARELARIHALDSSRVDLSFLPAFIPEHIDHPRPAPSDTALEDERIRRALEAAWPFPQHDLPALLHGDYWPGNILWRDERLAAVVDWEDAAAGDPLADLAISRLDLLTIYGQEMMETFTHHYLAAARVDTRSLPYWDLSAALRLARLAGADLDEWAAFFHPFGRTDITGQSIREHYLFFVSQAFEKLKII